MWNQLARFTPDEGSFINSNVSFHDDVANFYAINPTWLTGQSGESNSNLRQFLFNYAVCIDQASLNRYGYRPMMVETVWMSDIQGSAATSGNANIQQLMGTLLARLCGYYEAAALMASGDHVIRLRPDIQVGTRYSYAPFKDGVIWDFYIESVSHEFVYGGPSVTRLGLSRGLPHSVYAGNPSNDLLYNIHLGNAKRVDGTYSVGLPAGAGSAPSLKAILPTQFADWMTRLDQLYITAQGLTTNPP